MEQKKEIRKARFVEDDILARDNEKYKKESQSYYMQLAPTKVELTLMSDEIGNIIDELGRVQHDIFTLMRYDELIKKLRKALE